MKTRDFSFAPGNNAKATREREMQTWRGQILLLFPSLRTQETFGQKRQAETTCAAAAAAEVNKPTSFVCLWTFRKRRNSAQNFWLDAAAMGLT